MTDKMAEAMEAVTVHHDEVPGTIKLSAMTEKTVVAGAQDAADEEHDMTVREALVAYRRGVLWCLAISTCVIMEGYDQILITSFFAYPQFQIAYGDYVGRGSTGYQLSAEWQAALSNGSVIGAFFGSLANGILVDRFGHKRVLIGALVTLSAFIFITFFATNTTMLLVGQILSGLPWGVFATTAPAYASECLPVVLRVYFTSYTNMCFVIGQLIAAGVLRGLQSRPDEWAFRIPFALQWVWPIFLIPLMACAPPSPWHEVRKGRLESAEKSIRRLQDESAGIDPKKTLSMIIYTNNLEQELEVGTTYWDCFKGFELTRTEIACICFMGQPISGANFAYNSSYFFEQIGLDPATTYSLSLGGTALALVGTLINWFFIMPRFGRRPVYVGGMAVMATTLCLVGILQAWADAETVAFSQAALTLFWTLIFQMSVGQLGWAIPAEVGSTRLRQKTVCLARNSYYLINAICVVLQSYFINPSAWDLSGYTGFLWGGLGFLICIWAFFRLPETMGRTYEELDTLFANRVPARHFKKTDAQALGLHNAERLPENA